MKESHQFIKGLAPLKVMVDRSYAKNCSKINIETLLKQAESDFSNENPLDSWLPKIFIYSRF